MFGNHIRSYKGEVIDYTQSSELKEAEWNHSKQKNQEMMEPEDVSAEMDYHFNPDGEFYDEQKKMSFFFKIGIMVLSIMLVVGAGVYFIPKAVSTSTSSGRKLPIYCVNTDKPQVALSFDAAWGNEQTQTIIDICEKQDIKVTFFMTGGWIEKYPDSVKAIAAAGHELGNHSENHKQMSKLSKQQCMEEIKKPHNKVKELTGIEMKVFRPPFGDYNNTLVEAVNDCGYHCIQWDVDSLDWKDYGSQSIVNEVCCNKHLGNGSIILCHNGAKYILESLDTIISTLKDKGYEFVKMSDLIYKEDYYMDHEGRQFQK